MLIIKLLSREFLFPGAAKNKPEIPHPKIKAREQRSADAAPHSRAFVIPGFK